VAGAAGGKSSGAKPPGPRKTAAERRAAVLQAALPIFARDGINGASTEEIAAAAGISQPYLFRLFGTKRALFLAAVELGCAAIIRAFAEASEGLEGAEALAAMGRSYPSLIADHDLLLVQLQGFAAAGEPEIREFTSAQFAGIVHYVAGRTGLGPQAMREFFATGMLCNVIVALDLAGLDELWGDVGEQSDWLEFHRALRSSPGGDPPHS